MLLAHFYAVDLLRLAHWLLVSVVRTYHYLYSYIYTSSQTKKIILGVGSKLAAVPSHSFTLLSRGPGGTALFTYDNYCLLRTFLFPRIAYRTSQVKVSLLNFTITIKGLEEQLLNTAVKEELPDLAQKKVRYTREDTNDLLLLLL